MSHSFLLGAAPSLTELERLAAKYETLAVLRARREELHATGVTRFEDREGSSRRDAFRQLAREFPGALRELDATSAAVLRRKAAAVGEELARLRAERKDGDGEVVLARPWVHIVIEFHRVLREALEVKLWLARRLPRGGPLAALTPSLVEELRAWRGSEQAPDVRELHSLLHPPDGRVLGLVWSILAARHALDRATLEQLVFGDQH